MEMLATSAPRGLILGCEYYGTIKEQTLLNSPAVLARDTAPVERTVHLTGTRIFPEERSAQLRP
jgi:hypothetical protein